MTTPTARCRPLDSPAADGDGTYPSSAAAAWTACRVVSDTFGRPRSARETVAVETPLLRATSRMLVASPLLVTPGPGADGPLPVGSTTARVPAPLPASPVGPGCAGRSRRPPPDPKAP